MIFQNLVRTNPIKTLCIESKSDHFSADPYVRIIQVNPSGKVLRKKKTNTKEGGKEPIFNETLNFDLAPNQLESMNFVVMLSTKIDSPTEVTKRRRN